MPMYEYQCDGCNSDVEYIQKFSDPPMTKCEDCGGRLTKLLSAPSFHLTGGGWYADGYGDAKPKEKKSEGGGSDAKKSDAKDAKGSKGSKDTKGTKDKPSSDKGAGSSKKAGGKD